MEIDLIFILKIIKVIFMTIPREIEIILKDNHDNISSLKSTLNRENSYENYYPHVHNFEIDENQFHFVSNNKPSKVFIGNKFIQLQPYLSNLNQHYYLLDLRSGLP